MAQKAVSEEMKRLDHIKDIIHGNATKQQESTLMQMKQGAPKPALKIVYKV